MRLGRSHGQNRYRLKAFPSESVSALVAIVVVGSSVVALRQLSADKSSASSPQEKVKGKIAHCMMNTHTVISIFSREP